VRRKTGIVVELAVEAEALWRFGAGPDLLGADLLDAERLDVDRFHVGALNPHVMESLLR
jgi:hypothetical protein